MDGGAGTLIPPPRYTYPASTKGPQALALPMGVARLAGDMLESGSVTVTETRSAEDREDVVLADLRAQSSSRTARSRSFSAPSRSGRRVTEPRS